MKKISWHAVEAPNLPNKWSHLGRSPTTAKLLMLPETSGSTGSLFSLFWWSLFYYYLGVKIWTWTCFQVDVNGWLEAFAAHPKIGESPSQKSKSITSAQSVSHSFFFFLFCVFYIIIIIITMINFGGIWWMIARIVGLTSYDWLDFAILIR